jgi:hypothetical protein
MRELEEYFTHRLDAIRDGCDPDTVAFPTCKSNTTEALLTERGETHGTFADNAFYSQRLRELFRSDEDNWNSIPDRQREALEMIAGKISRILSGAADFPDHWEDIAGYATLAVEVE